jgi:putative oxidoreductase
MNLQAINLLAARVLLAVMFLMAGLSKLGAGYEGTQGYMEAMGVPGALLPLVILLEIGGAIALIIGFKTKLAAVALAVFTVAAALLFHANFDDHMQSILFMKNMAVTGGFLALISMGAGRISVDNLFTK